VTYRASLLIVVGHAPFADLARSFLLTAPRILKFLNDHRPPFIAKVHRASPQDAERKPESPGRVELWYPRD
jgi:hypothetical protein